jgi:hypothetical protein
MTKSQIEVFVQTNSVFDAIELQDRPECLDVERKISWRLVQELHVT